MELRKAKVADLPAIMTIISDAITILNEQGSLQWQNGFGPSQMTIEEDIRCEKSYVLVDEKKILGTAALIAGVDPVYTAIEQGHWQKTEPYLSIHRVAVTKEKQGRGLATIFLQGLIATSKNLGIHDIRIDTHERNIGMQKAISKAGFSYRGIVTFPIPDGKRKAYQLLL